MEPRVLDVFHHTAEPEVTEELRTTVVHDIRWLYDAFPDIRKVPLADLDPNVYKALKRKYDSLLHFGSFNLTKSRSVAYELIWKWTEATGKYVGCQFWSRSAKRLFDAEVSLAGGWPITQATAKEIQRRLSEKSTNGAKRLPTARLTHEHVYPIKNMKQLLYWNAKRTTDEIRGIFDRYCVGCVVVESEHDRLSGDDTNPWNRYAKAGIVLADNPAWTTLQRTMIVEACLLEN
jgi:hypothetical protein